jgi:hypothetical protein
MSSGDDYASAAKPVIDWDDAQAREELIDSRARDGFACLAVLEGRALSEPMSQAANLLATVLGQDLEQRDDGGFAITRRVAADRVISTVDPQARHGHKTAARGFDGYKGHLAVDPDSEIITNTTVTAGNAGDASVAEDLISDLLAETDTAGTDTAGTDTAGTEAKQDERATGGADTPRVYGDNAYGTAGFHDQLEQAGIEDRCKTQQPVAAGGMFAKDRFAIDLHADTVRCPAGHTAPIRRRSNGAGTVSFWPYCTHCPLRQQCTTAPDGRTVTVGAYERQLAAARARQRDSDWITDYQTTRPKVERKIAHT